MLRGKRLQGLKSDSLDSNPTSLCSLFSVVVLHVYVFLSISACLTCLYQTLGIQRLPIYWKYCEHYKVIYANQLVEYLAHSIYLIHLSFFVICTSPQPDSMNTLRYEYTCKTNNTIGMCIIYLISFTKFIIC